VFTKAFRSSDGSEVSDIEKTFSFAQDQKTNLQTKSRLLLLVSSLFIPWAVKSRNIRGNASDVLRSRRRLLKALRSCQDICPEIYCF
jgi:hypothetical protein